MSLRKECHKVKVSFPSYNIRGAQYPLMTVMKYVCSLQLITVKPNRKHSIPHLLSNRTRINFNFSSLYHFWFQVAILGLPTPTIKPSTSIQLFIHLCVLDSTLLSRFSKFFSVQFKSTLHFEIQQIPNSLLFHENL